MAKGKGDVRSGGAIQFLSDCRAELHKISRPTKDETVKATLVTILMVAFLSIALSIFDFLFNRLMSVLLS